MAKRRQWMEELNPNTEKEQPKKKSKIKILREEVYIDGKLVSKTSEDQIPNTPHQIKLGNKKLTPTFRKPKTYLQKTNEVLKIIAQNKCSQNDINDVSLDDLYFYQENKYDNNNYINDTEQSSQTLPENSSFSVTMHVDRLSHEEINSLQEMNTSCYGDKSSDSQLENVSSGTKYVFSLHEAALNTYPFAQRNSDNCARVRLSRSASFLHNTSAASDKKSYVNLGRSSSLPREITMPKINLKVRLSRSASLPRCIAALPENYDNIRLSRSASFPRCMSPVSKNNDGVRLSRSASLPRCMFALMYYDNNLRLKRAASLSHSMSAFSEKHKYNLSRNTKNTRIISPNPETNLPSHDGQFGDLVLRNVSPVPEIIITPYQSPVPEKPREKIIKKHVRTCKKKLQFDQSYLDFVDEDDALLNEAFPSDDTGSWSEEGQSSETDLETSTKKKKEKKKNKKQKKKSKSVKEINDVETDDKQVEKGEKKSTIRKRNKLNKQKGESYVTEKGKLIKAKEMKPNPCSGKKCGNKCGTIPEERRQSLFKYFWSLQNRQRQKDWIAQITVRKAVKRSTLDTPIESRRGVTYEYYINEGEERRRVCQQFLIATLDITQRFILYTAETVTDGFAKADERGKHVSHNKTPDAVLNHAKSFILSLPLLPSHYCRKDTKKLYLPEDFKNVTNLYDIYEKKCAEEEVKPMSFKVFSTYFKENFNIGFHVPKKDKCILCSEAKTYDVYTKEQMEKINNHLKDKEDTQSRFIFHQNLNNVDKSTICASFDLQKVLNTPHGRNMALYYSRKIAVYNFTIYESGTQHGFCNVWSEIDAHRGANEIASCLLNYIRNVDARGHVKSLLLYSDSCFGQNKNKTVLCMLRYALSKCENLETIQINYLLPGHTYMPVDSMHATIERSIRQTIVWAPSQWPTVIGLSRKNPFPYEVAVHTGKDFQNFDEILSKTFKKNQKVMVSQIRVATFKTSNLNIMTVKSSMATDAKSDEVQLDPLNDVEPKPNLYSTKLPISFQKYNDLKKLIDKKVIPPYCAPEYLNMKYNKKTVDRLPETDDEE